MDFNTLVGLTLIVKGLNSLYLLLYTSSMVLTE